MRKSSLRFSLVLLFLGILITSGGTQSCSIINEDGIQGSNIFVSTNEIADFYLEDWFQGSNLTYSVNPPDLIKGVSPIQNPLNKKGKNKQYIGNQDDIIDTSFYQKTNGDDIYSMLIHDIMEPVDLYQQFVAFGTGNDEGEVNFDFENMYLIPNSNNQSMNCLDIIELDEDRVIVDCLQFDSFYQGQARYKDQFFIVNRKNISFPSAVNFSDYTYDGIDSRRSEIYVNQNLTMVVQGNFRDEFKVEEDEYNTPYLMVYTYIPDASDDKPQGTLTDSRPLEYDDFGFEREDFDPTDFDIFGDRIYLLIRNYGIISFKHQGKKIDQSSLIKKSFADLLIDQPEATAISITGHGPFIQAVLICRDKLLVFRFLDFADQIYYTRVFDLPFVTLGTPVIQTNHRYIAIQAGQLLAIYDTADANSLQFHTVLRTVESFELLSSNLLHVYYQDYYATYSLQEPVLQYIGGLLSTQPREIQITAESRFFTQVKQCKLTLNRYVLAPNDLGPREKLDRGTYTYEFENELEKDILLNEQFAGPNLLYRVNFGKTSDPAAANEESFTKMDLPTEIEIELHPEVDASTEIFSKVLQALNNNQLQLRQLKNNTVLIHTCITYYESKEFLNCTGAPVNIKLGGAILHMSYGEVNDNLYLGFVTADAKDKITFTNLNGDPAPFTFDESELGEIKDFIILNQLLYVLGSSNGVGMYKIFKNQIQRMAVIDQNYVADWTLAEHEPWEPNRINAHFSLKNILFVELSKSVVLISIENDHVPVYLNQIPGIRSGYRGFLSPRTYSIVGYNDTAITEYSLNDLTDIEESNQMPKYNFSYYDDISKGVVIGNFTHNIYVLGYMMVRGEEKAALLVYNTQTNNFEQLYTVIEIVDFTAEQLRSAKSVQLSADGREQIDFVLLNVDGARVMMRVPVKPRLLVLPEDIYPKFEYSSSIDFSYHVTGMDDSVEPKEVTKTVVFINPQKEIFINEKALSDSQFSQGIEITSQKEQVIPLESYDWFNGPVLTKSLSCYDCLGDTSGKNLIRLKSRVQEQDETQVPPSKGIRQLLDPKAAFFYAETKHIHILTDQLEVIEYSTSTFDIRKVTNLELNPYFYSCQEYLPCKNEKPLSIDPNRLLYGVAICKGDNQVIASVAEYQTLDKPTQHVGTFKIPNVSNFVDAKCIDSKLYFLDFNDKTNETNLQVYDLYNDIEQKSASLTLLKTINTKSLGLESAEFTSFDAIKIQNTDSLKVLLTQSTKFLVVLDIDGATLEVTKIGEQQLLDKLNVEQELAESLSYLKPDSPILNVRILRHYKSQDKTFLRMDALIVIEDSPIYQIQLVFESFSGKYVQDEWLITKVYQNYGDHKVQKRLSISDDYFAASYFKYDEKVFTVVVYSLLDDQRSLDGADLLKPQYEPVWGGREFTQTFYQVTSPFVVYYRQEVTTKNYGVVIPPANYFEQTVVMEINDDDYLLVKPGLARSQRLTFFLDSYFATWKTPDLYGFIEPLAQFDVKPFCEVISDLYETPSKLINSANTREEYILRNAFIGFNLSYSYNSSTDLKEIFRLEGSLKEVYSEGYKVQGVNIIATDQIFESSGLSTVASLSVKRSQLASEYTIWVGVEQQFLFPKLLKSYTIGFREDMQCHDLEFVTPQQLVIYCVFEKTLLFKTKFYDYFYVINIPGDNDIKEYQGLELLLQGTINSGKIMFYQDPADSATNYLVTGPLFDSRDPGSQAFDGYVRIYKLSKGVVSSATYSTLTGDELLGMKLTLADFDVVDNIIYLLDSSIGIYSFTFDYKSLNKNISQRVYQVNWFPNHVKGFNYNIGYGLDVDYDGAQLSIVIAEFDQVLLYQQNRFSKANPPVLRGAYPSDVQLQNRPDIQLSNNFIGVRSGQILTIYRRDQRMSSVATLSSVQSFNLEISENLYTWSKNEVTAYLLGEPFLWVDTVDSSKLSTDLNLTVSSTNSILGQQVNCTVRFSSQGVPKDTLKLYKTSTESTVFSSDNPVRAKNIPIDQQVVGPNIEFSLAEISLKQGRLFSGKERKQSQGPLGEDIVDTVTADLDVPRFIEFDRSKLDSSKIIFSQLVAIDNQEFIKIHQLQDFSLLFQECMNPYDQERFADCNNISTRRNLSSPISSFTTGLYGRTPAIVVVQSSEPNIIYRFSVLGGLIEKIQLTSDPISSLVLNKQLLFFISNKSVYVIDTADEESTRSIINKEYVQNWRIDNFDPEEFDPLEIEAHHSEGNLLIIRLRAHVLLVSVELKSPRFISAFEYDEQSMAGAICESHLLRDVFLTLCNKNFIETYSVLINTSPSKLNNFEKYGYAPYIKNSRHLVAYGNYSGLVYVLAQDSKNATTLLVYRAHAPNIRTLLKAIEVPSTKYDGSQPVQITASGYTRIDFVYISVGSAQFLARVPHNQQLSVEPARYYPYDRYTKQYLTKFQAEGMDGSTLKESITLQFYNPQTRLLEDEDAIDDSGINKNDGLEMTSEMGQAFTIPVDKLVYGPAISYSIECRDCPGGEEGTGIITVQNKVVPVDKSFGRDLSLFKDVEGSFQNKFNHDLYILNNKRAYHVARSNFTAYLPFVKLNLDDEAECFNYIPCYTPNLEDESQEKLLYAVAICKDGSKWYAATVDYSGQIADKLAAIELEGIQDFVQAQCYDESLLVLHTDPKAQESKIDVFEFFLAIQDLRDKNTTVSKPYRTYSPSSLQISNWTSKVLSGFEVTKTDNIDYRRLIVSGKINNFTTLEINAGDYTLKYTLPNQYTIDIANKLLKNKQYVPNRFVEIVSIKVLSYYDFNKTTQSEGVVKRFHTRVLFVLRNLPLIEFLIDTPVSRQVDDFTTISILGLYSHIGDTEVSRYISVGSEEFVVQYYSPKLDILTVAVYKINTEADLDEEDELFLTPIFGGYALKDIDFYDFETPVPVLVYVRERILDLPREVRILVPYPQFYEREPILLHVGEKTEIIAFNSNFQTQQFQLIPESIHTKAFDQVSGIITPYDPELVDIETEPYCRILNGKFQESFNLWNSINKTEQYLLDEIFEGYNLSYSFESLFDSSVNYEIFDTLQETDANDFIGEEVMEIDDFSIFENKNEEAYIIRFGLKKQKGNSFYSVSFFEGSQIFAPTYQGSLTIPTRDSFQCYSVTHLNSKVGAMYCTEYVDYLLTAHVYREVFFLLYEGTDGKYSYKKQDIKIDYTFAEQMYSGKTVALGFPDDRSAYLISASLLVPNKAYNEEQDGTYLSVYEYVQKPGEQVGELFVSRHSQITAGELGLDSGLNIIDIQVYDDRIFILDYSQLIISFSYNSDDGVTGVSSLSLVSFGFLEAWGFHIKQQSAFTAIFVATNSEVVHFVQAFGNYSGKAVVRHKYPLEDELIVRPIIHSSGKYVAVQIDSMLTIYEKGQTESQRVFRNIPKVQGYNLFQDNYLYVWQKHGVTSYLLEQPHLNVRANKESSLRFPVLTAISWNRFLDRNQTCRVNFYPKNIDPSSMEARRVFKNEAEYFESDAEEEKNIFLDNHYIGPNLEYELMVKNGETTSFEVDLAREIEINYPPEYIKDSVFDKIIQVTDNLQLQIHQVRANYTVQFLSCKTQPRNILVMDCRLLQTLSEITSKITVYAHGLFREEPSFLIVQESEPTKIYQYLYTGLLMFHQQVPDITQIIDIELSQNTMFVLDKETIRREIRIYSTLLKDGLKLISVIDDTYASQWGIEPNDFLPQYISTHYNYEDVLLIKFSRLLLAVSTQTSVPEYLTSKYLDDSGPVYENFVLTANYLWDVRSDGIALYDVRDEKSFGKLYDLELYDYNFIVPDKTGFQYAVSNPSGFIYVVGEKFEGQGDQYVVLLVFRETAQSIKNLYTVIDTRMKYVKETSYITITADGFVDVDFVQLNIDGDITTIRVPHHPSLIYYPGPAFPLFGQSAEFTFDYAIFSMDPEAPPIEDSVKIIMVNSHENIYLNTEEINNSKFSQGIEVVKRGEETIPLSSQKWYNGPVLRKRLTCELCDGEEPLIRLKNRVQEIDESLSGVDLKKLPNATASFFYAETEDLHVLNYDNEVVQYSAETYETRDRTKLGDDNFEGLCVEYLPCKSNKIDLYPDRLLYGVAICESEGEWVAAVVEYFTLGKPAVSRGIYHLKSATWYLDAKCMDSHLYFLDKGQESNETQLIIYDLYEGVKDNVHDLIILKVLNSSEVFQGSANFTSFDIVKLFELNHRKILMLSGNGTLVAFDFNSKTLEVTRHNLIQLSNKFNLHNKLAKSSQYIDDRLEFMNIRSIKYVNTSGEVSQGIITALLVIENSPVYQIEIVYEKEDTYYQRPELFIKKVYQNYGSHEVQKRLSFEKDSYFAVSYFSQDARVFTVLVYALGESDQAFRSSSKNAAVEYQQILGGVQFTETPLEVTSPFLVFSTSNFQTGKKAYKLLVPSDNFAEPTSVSELSYDDYLLTGEYLDASQQLVLELDNFFDQESTVKIFGYLEVAYNFDTEPHCEILNDQYSTPSQLFNSNQTREQYILRDSFSGFNLSYSLVHASPTKQDFSLESSPLVFWGEEKINFKRQNVIGTTQVTDSSGASTLARLAMTRTQYGEQYHVWVAQQSDPLQIPRELSSFELEYNQNIRCLDIELVTPEWLTVYCLELVDEDVDLVKYYDFFYVINTTKSTNQVSTFDGTEVPVTQFLESAKMMSYTDANDSSINYIVTAPLIEDADSEFANYVRIYEFRNGKISLSPSFTIEEKDLELQYLQIADFDILDDIIYILDHTQGIYSFTFDFQGQNKNTSQRINQVNVFINGVARFSYQYAWALDVDYDGAQIVIVIAESKRVLLFTQNRALKVLSPVQKGVYPADALLQHRPEIQISNRFIGLRLGQYLTIYRKDFFESSIATRREVYSFNLEYQESLYVWNKEELEVYNLEDPNLVIESEETTTLSTDVNLTVTSTNSILSKQVNCTVRFFSFVVDKATTDLKNARPGDTVYSSDNPFAIKNIPIDQQIVGPNVQFESLDLGQQPLGDDIEERFEALFDYPSFLNIENSSKMNTSDIIFSKVVSTFDSAFTKVHQFSNFTLQFQDCQNIYDSLSSASCKIVKTDSNLTSLVSESFYGLYGGQPVFGFVQSSQLDTLYIYQLSLNSYLRTQQFQGVSMSGLVLNKQLLFFISNKSVYVIDAADESKIRAVINKDYIKDWELGNLSPTDFDPYEVDAHSSEGNIVFIRLKAHVLIVSVEAKAPRLASQFQYDEQDLDGAFCESHLLKDAFLTLCNTNFIESYSLISLNRVETLNNFQKYGYSPYVRYNRHLAAVSESSGLVYILGADQSNNTVLLVYRSHTQNIRTLYKVLPLSSGKYDGTQLVQVTATGSQFIDFVYFVMGSTEYLVRVPHNQQLFVRPGRYYPYDGYTNQVSSTISATGMNGQSKTETIKLQFYNPQTRLLEDEKAIEESGIQKNDGLEMDSPKAQSFPLSIEKLQYGPVMSYTISCPDCPEGYTKSNIISVQNKIEDVSTSIGGRLNRFTEVEGAFQNAQNKELYILNDKLAHQILKLNFDDVNFPVKLDVSVDADCRAYVPCYAPNLQDNEKLDYTVAICEDEGHWVAAPVDYTGTIHKQMPRIKLPDVQNFIQAQCMDHYLLVLTTDHSNTESKIYVYNLYLDLQDKNEKATLIMTYDKQNLHFAGTNNYVITGFEVFKTETPDIRRLFVTQRYNNFSTMGINSSQYHLIEAAPIELTMDIANRMSFNKLYYPGDKVETISLKVLQYYNFTRTTPSKGSELRYHYRVLILLKNLPSIEFLVDCPPKGKLANVTKISMLGLYAHIGDTEISRYVTVSEKEFALQFYSNQMDSVSIAVYYINKGTQLDEDPDLLFTPIHCGYQMTDIGFYDHDSPIPILLYSETTLTRTVRVFVPYPLFYEIEPKVFQIHKEFAIRAANSSFSTQYFELIPDSIYAGNRDKILGTISPYDSNHVAILTEPYCKVLNERWESRFNLWNSIDKTEQYLLDEFFEGYNLSFKINTLKGSDTTYTVYDTLQKVNERNLSNSDVKDVLDIATSSEVNEQISMIRLGYTLYNYKKVYSLTFFSASEQRAPVSRERIEIDGGPDLECKALTYANNEVGLLYCLEELSSAGSFKYREIFYFFQFNKQGQLVQLSQNMTQNFTTSQEVLSAKTIALQGNQTYIFSAPVVAPDQPSDDLELSFISVYQYTENSDKSQIILKEPFKSRITSEDLQFDYGLNIAGIQALGSRVYILDYRQGIVSFQFNGSNLVDLQRISLVGHSIREAWGFLVKQQSAYISVFVATDRSLYHFVTVYGNTSSPIELQERYTLESDLLGRPEIQSSGKYIAVQNKKFLTIYERGSYKPQKVFRNIEGVQGYNLFIDNYLYIWRKRTVTSYLLEQPHMNIRAYEERKSVLPSIEAISWNSYLEKNMTCTLYFNSTNIDAASTEARKVQSDNKPLFETNPNIIKNIYLDQHYVGPNLKYEIKRVDTLSAHRALASEDPESKLSLDIPTEIKPQYPAEFVKDSIFSKLIQVTDSLQLQLHQSKSSNQTQLLECNTTLKNLTTVNCKVLAQLTDIKSPIKVYAQGWFRVEPSILLVQESEQAMVYVYHFNGTRRKSFQLEKVTKIIDIELARNTMYALVQSASEKEIQIYSTLPKDDPMLITRIDKNYSEEWEFPTQEFKPLNIFTHNSFLDLLFIKFEKILVAVSTQTARPELLASKFIFSELGYSPDSFAVTTNYLWNIQSDGISLYDIRDEKDFGILYDLELYDYFLVVPDKSGFHYSIAESSGFLYLVVENALDTLKHIQIMIIREQGQNIRNIYSVVDTNLTYNKATSDISISASGSLGVDFVLLNVDGNIFTIRVPHHPTLVVEPGKYYPKQGYSSSYNLSFTIKSMDSKQTAIEEQLEVIVVNTQTEVFFDEEVIKKSPIKKENGGLISPENENSIIPIQTDGWFVGPVLGLKLSCKDACATERDPERPLSIQNKVSLDASSEQVSQIVDVKGSFYSPVDKVLYILNQGSLTVTNEDFKELNSTNLFQPSDRQHDECFQLIPCYGVDNKVDYIVAICDHGGDLLSYPVKVTGGSDLQKVPPLKINSNGGHVESQCFNKNLFVLQKEQVGGTEIGIYDFYESILNKRSSLIKLGNLTQEFISLNDGSLPITSFVVTSLQGVEDHFKIFITQESKWITIFGLNKNYKVRLLEENYFNVVKQLSQAKVFIQASSKLVNLKILSQTSSTLDNITSFVFDTIVMIENSPIIQLEFTLQLNLTSNRFLNGYTHRVEKIYVQYGDLKLLSHFSIIGNYFAVSYYSELYRTYSVVVYDENVKVLGDGDAVPVYHIRGGIQQNTILSAGKLPNAPFQLLLDSKNQPKIFSPNPEDDESSEAYAINEGVSILVKNNNFQSQEIQLEVSSVYSEDSQAIYGWIKSRYDKGEKSGTSNLAWIIPISIIGGLLLFGGIGYFVWKKRKESLARDNDDVSEGGYSLQEQSNQSVQ